LDAWRDAPARLARRKNAMKPLMIAALAAGALVCATGAKAQDAQALFNKSGCTTCHAVDKKIVGPTLKEISAKYKGDKTAEAKLAEKVKKGGSGVWGQVPMPPNAAVKDEDIKTMVHWILTM
jgi:cytochrome c